MASADMCEHDWPGSGCPECRASLSPAATPVSEAETVAWQTVSDFVDEMLRDWSGGDDCRMGFGVNGATVTKGQFRAVRSALASLSPAATSGSEGGGEAPSCYNTGLRCLAGCDGRTCAGANVPLNQWPEPALAKPASSPAGGDVVQTLIDKTEKLIEAADDMGWSCNSSSADQAIREAKDAVRAALSQSTSPDNDPTASGETVGSFRDRGPVATNPPGRGGRDQNSTSGEAGE